MVISRYVCVLRSTGKTLRSHNFLNVREVKHALARKIEHFRFNSTQKSVETECITEKPPIGSLISDDPKISKSRKKSLQMTSSAATDFSSVSRTSTTESDIFGDNYFTSLDVSSNLEISDNVELPGALDTCDEDLSHVTPYVRPTFNFAAYANNSPTIQELAKLGVDLHRVEKQPKAMEILLKREFAEMKPYIQFLHDCGVTADEIGKFLTKNPFIMAEDLEDLHTRIRYLRAHEFNAEMVARIVSKNPFWLMFNTRRIDNRLGYFQREFKLNGPNIRHLTTRQPRLITYSFDSIRQNVFAFREEMGFDKLQVQTILLNKPRLFMKQRQKIVEIFDYAHNTMKLSHEIITQQPIILSCRLSRLRQRHKYLEVIGRAQYDPTKPMYASPAALTFGTDIDFCRDVAKTTVETYNMFLKTL